MTLAQCTKEDLIWIINRLLQMCCFHQKDYYLTRALSDLHYHKEKVRIGEAEKIGKFADAKWQEYIEIMRPYDGWKITDIPGPALEKAIQALEAADAAEKKILKLMRLEGSDG